MSIRVFSETEVAEIYDLISELSGNDPGNVFAWDGTDTLDNVNCRAMFKVFRTVGASVPQSLLDEFDSRRVKEEKGPGYTLRTYHKKSD